MSSCCIGLGKEHRANLRPISPNLVDMADGGFVRMLSSGESGLRRSCQYSFWTAVPSGFVLVIRPKLIDGWVIDLGHLESEVICLDCSKDWDCGHEKIVMDLGVSDKPR